jgi:hypothetical protein
MSDVENGSRPYSLYLGASSEYPGLLVPQLMEVRVWTAEYKYEGDRRPVFDGRTALMSRGLHLELELRSLLGEPVDLGSSVIAIEDDYMWDAKAEEAIGQGQWYRTAVEQQAATYEEETSQKTKIRRLVSPGIEVTDDDYDRIDSPRDVLVNWGFNRLPGHIHFLTAAGYRVVRKVHANDGVPISSDKVDLLTHGVDALAVGVDDHHKLQGKLDQTREMHDRLKGSLVFDEQSSIERLYRKVSETNGYYMLYISEHNVENVQEGSPSSTLLHRARTMFRVAEEVGTVPQIVLQTDPRLPRIQGKIYSAAGMFLSRAYDQRNVR